MMTTVNRRITLASRPLGYPKVSDFDLAFAPVPSPGAGEVLVRLLYLSLDPYMRGQMNGTEPWARSLAIGDVMNGGAVAFVLQSLDPDFEVGDAVAGMCGWQEYAVVRGSELRKIDANVAPLSTALGVLGMPGLTAYFGLLDVGEPHRGDDVVVSGAAGAVGMIVGQIAKILECRVVGVAGAETKISWLLDELGFDAAVNYKSTTSLDEALSEVCPDGIDVYFDNVGGAVTDAVLRRIAMHARIAVCGQVSQSNLMQPELGPRWMSQLIVRQAKVEGFLVSTFAARFPEGRAQLTRWLQEGRLKYREDVAQGIESAPQAFIGMLQGKSQGKQLVQVSEP